METKKVKSKKEEVKTKTANARLCPKTHSKLVLLARYKEMRQIDLLEEVITKALIDFRNENPEFSKRIDAELSKT